MRSTSTTIKLVCGRSRRRRRRRRRSRRTSEEVRSWLMDWA
jgi:hypothetical protein